MSTGLLKQTPFIAGPGMGSGNNDRGSRRVEYLLVIYPYGDIHDQLLEEQQQFATEYGLGYGVKTSSRNKPHITVAAFQAGEVMEDTLIRWIQRICNRHRSFDITLNNYSGFPPHTIFLRVQDPKPFRELMQQLRAIDDYIRSSGCPPVNLVNRPYLSIAGGLTEQVYNKAMPDYSRKTFHGSFQVQELVLLKREHSFDSCKTVNIFRLLPDDGTTPLSPAWALPHL
ncbi:MAG TPA: 2'-5' RNA ligase family protein [Puia sp.]|jgi:2'-5' RNA ligase